ncbi:MAG: putative colanic acid biosynthesis UDP-glucose lipid carrier transferase [Candidatus Azotimanducaceae bacterium]|jgi:putative colanic acid biosynthesis UDP-glucose lipid carrier transferase
MLTDDSRKLFREIRSARTWVQMILDHVLVQSLLFLHTFTRTEQFSDEYRTLAIIIFLLMLIIYNMTGIYRHENARNDYISSLLQAWGSLVLLLAIFGFVTKTSEGFSREVILTWSVTGFLGQCVIYFICRRSLANTRAERIATLIVGAGDLGHHIANHINRNQWVSDQVVGVIDDNAGIAGSWQDINIPHLGTLEEINNVVTEHGIRRVYIAIPMAESALVKPLAIGLVESNIDVIWAPDIFGVSLLNHAIKEIAGVPLISLSETPLVGGSALAKTTLDKSLAFIALLVLSPVMIIVALLVKLTSSGPVLFKQRRHGWDGRELLIYKFRSMKVHEENEGQVTQATKDDNRLTPIGGFIRRSSIDELPQLFNVLEGSMSLVGPRPHAIAHNDFYKGKIRAYMLRHRIKPGLTGLAQVNGFRGETDTIDKMQSRINYDLAYINNWSIWLDIEIMFKTLFVLIGKNAY